MQAGPYTCMLYLRKVARSRGEPIACEFLGKNLEELPIGCSDWPMELVWVGPTTSAHVHLVYLNIDGCMERVDWLPEHPIVTGRISEPARQACDFGVPPPRFRMI